MIKIKCRMGYSWKMREKKDKEKKKEKRKKKRKIILGAKKHNNATTMSSRYCIHLYLPLPPLSFSVSFFFSFILPFFILFFSSLDTHSRERPQTLRTLPEDHTVFFFFYFLIFYSLFFYH